MDEFKGELDFGWGNPYFLLQVLTKGSLLHTTQSVEIPTMSCSYGPDEGNYNLIQQTRKVIQQTTGLNYKYVFMTNGATQAINSILRWAKNAGYGTVNTTKYGYPFYDHMIKKAGLHRRKSLVRSRPPARMSEICLIDSPSNPEGKLTSAGCSLHPDIWDSVYHNKIYVQNEFSLRQIIPGHKIMVGSYSKLLGLTGARVGWIATDDHDLYRDLADDTLYELATVNIFSQKLILDLLLNNDLDEFMNRSRAILNNNRSDFQLLEKFFDGQSVQENGMFYFAQANDQTRKLLQKCDVKYVDFDDDYVRMNVGQSTSVVQELIKRIKQEDRI